MSAGTLLLFDVDGTLVWRATDAHARALHDALLAVHGVDASRLDAGISFAGRTDGEIARAYLLVAGVSAARIDERAAEVREICGERYAALCPPDLSAFVLPGVPELLSWLAELSSAPGLALLTGNYEAVARLKLARAGIGKFFESGQGAFGSDSEDRAALPAIARRRAGSRGSPFPRDRTIVIGDTPRDIACARADGVRCFAVASGASPADELTAADSLAADAFELREQLAAGL
ncbi:MAG TPA: haloacid dehalogenase-like hydrolase [Solirubrobacteraceae bacterium]|nr:haloacid dehalogenase-like hydrolase [Solirubrobacteraceae bacterium]